MPEPLPPVPEPVAQRDGAMVLGRRRFIASLLAVPIAARAALGLGNWPASRRSRQHVAVIGAGAFGGWTALALLRAGARVTLVDAWGAGNARASSGGETRVIRAVYNGEPAYTRMVARALELWRDNERRWGRQLFFPVGCLWMFAGDDSYARRSAPHLRDAGLPLDELSARDAGVRFPQMRFSDVRTILFEPRAGYLLARQACELVREAFVREGGDYKVALARESGSTRGRIAVRLSDGGSLDADTYVFACGPWLSTIFPDVIGRRIVPTRQEVFFFGVPAGSTLYESGAVPAWVHMSDRIVYGVPGNERRGLKVADDSAGPEVDPTSMDRTPTMTGIANARRILGERFPALADAPLLESRVCQYEASSDGHFLVDRHPDFENVWLVGGGSGHGFKMGPAMGEHVAALVQGNATPTPLFAYRRLVPARHE